MVDRFTLALLGTVALASVLPVHGEGAVFLGWLANAAIALLFFLHGAKLSREAIVAGLTHVRLHGFVVVATFVLFPIVGLLLSPISSRYLPFDLARGLLLLCALPATVTSAIAFTSIARGNVPAAICSSSASTLLGLVLTPILARLLLGARGGPSFDAGRVLSLVGQILVPFVVGHLLRARLAPFLAKHGKAIGITDRGSILLVVYGAFSASVTEGLWKKTSPIALLVLGALCLVILVVVLLTTTFASRACGFSKEDEITAVFCGSKKSLASGIAMARVLFPAAAMGAMVLPLMVFHQLQLMVCAALAARYARRPPTADSSPA